MDPLLIAKFAEIGVQLLAAAVVSLIGFVEPALEETAVQTEQVSSIEMHRPMTVDR